MPSLIRFLATIAILAGIAFGTMFVLAEFVEPEQSEMSHRVPKDKLPN